MPPPNRRRGQATRRRARRPGIRVPAGADLAPVSLPGGSLDIGPYERKLGAPLRSKEVVLVSVALEPDRDTRSDETQALEEIRQLFARYRQIARHGVVAEHDQPVEAGAQEPSRAPVPPER